MVPCAPTQGFWDPRFGDFGAEGTIYAIAVSATDVYVGGSFTTAGGVIATNIVRWDGSTWWPLDQGLDGAVYALAVMGTNLIAGGQFSNAGGTGTTNVAFWNGTNWAPLDTGIDGPVYA